MPTSGVTIKTENKEYLVSRVTKESIRDVALLHAEVYGVPVQEDFFRKKFDTAHTGVEYVGFVAYNKDRRPIAYYGVLPCLIEYDNNIILAAQSADTMTHPGYRYKGMFVELSNMTFDLCRELGIYLIFGFPNQNSYHGAVNKLGWIMTDAMSGFVIPVKTSFPVSIFRKIKPLRKFYEQYRQFILRKYIVSQDGVSNSVIAEGHGGVHRNAAYLRYKTYSPSRVIKIDDAKIWWSSRNDALIGDMENVNESNVDRVMNQLKKIAGRLGIKEMQFHGSTGIQLHSLLEKRFKPMPSYPVLFQDFGSPAPPGKIKFTFADIDIF
jgi:hypothetical protein